MKRANQYAGLFGCGAFTLLTYTILLNSQQLDRLLWVSLPGALVAGFFGYHIGNTLSNPKRRRKRKIVHLPEVAPTPAAAEPVQKPEASSSSSETAGKPE